MQSGFQRSLYWYRQRALARLHALSIAQADDILPLSSILALQSHRNEDIATTFKPERVTRRALRQAEALPTFSALTLFPNPLAAVFLHGGGNTAHQQNLNRVKFHA